ncbi:MAG: response regulator [Acidobacteriota bacterium]
MGPKIAVVDDEPKIREFLRAVLEGAGYEVVEAADGLSGLALVEKERPACLVTDLLLPRLSGFKLCQQIKGTPSLSSTPVVLVTGVYRKDRYRTEGKQHGADAYLTKPVSPEELLAAVREFAPLPTSSQKPAAVPEDFQEKLNALREVFASGVGARLDEMDALWSAVRSGQAPADGPATLHRMVHSLAGTAGTFGYTALSVAARSVEHLLADMAEGGTPIPADAEAAVSEGLSRLRELSARPDVLRPEIEVVPARYIEPPPGASRTGKLILLVDDDRVFALNLGMQISHFGYDVRTVARLEDLAGIAGETPPAAIILDILFTGETEKGTEAARRLFPEGRPRPPLVFLSEAGDFATRLEAVRAGGAAFFTKPVELGDLIGTLDSLTNPRPVDPLRVLIVEDEPALAEHFGLLLGQAGMKIAKVNRPQDALQALSEFNPELVLMDLYMPGCNGLELAAVIRQIPGFLTLPIVFLSVESRIQQQMKAIDLGADDFLTKNIAPQYLISSVTARAQRARILQSFMSRDGLTGLLNHTHMKEQIVVEVARSRRVGSPLSLAMIDVDRFKEVNDTHGHATGDRVLKSLSYLLRQRLRRTDVLGRFGGDEFAVLLTDTTADRAAGILDEVRAAFAQVIHPAEGTTVTCTLSVGVAGLEEGMDAQSLSEAADRALYLAKEGGRNRVAPARP